jgi:hypothetical protein
MIPDPLAMIPEPVGRADRGERSPAGRGGGPRLVGWLAWAWRDAETAATLAYAAWCRDPGADRYAAYRAAQDRADAAQDVLSRRTARHRGV